MTSVEVLYWNLTIQIISWSCDLELKSKGCVEISQVKRRRKGTLDRRENKKEHKCIVTAT